MELRLSRMYSATRRSAGGRPSIRRPTLARRNSRTFASPARIVTPLRFVIDTTTTPPFRLSDFYVAYFSACAGRRLTPTTGPSAGEGGGEFAAAADLELAVDGLQVVVGGVL